MNLRRIFQTYFIYRHNLMLFCLQFLNSAVHGLNPPQILPSSSLALQEKRKGKINSVLTYNSQITLGSPYLEKCLSTVIMTLETV
jgi:hypothetical protein